MREGRSRLGRTVRTSHKQTGKRCWPGNATPRRARDMFALLRSGSAAELGAVSSQCSFVTAAACLIVFNERRSTENRVQKIACLGASVKHVSLRVKEDPWVGPWPLGSHRMRIQQQQFSGSVGDVNDNRSFIEFLPVKFSGTYWQMRPSETIQEATRVKITY